MVKIITAFIAGMFALFCISEVAFANHDERSWRPAQVRTMVIGNNMGPEWTPAITAAAAKWSASTGGNPVRLTVVKGAGLPNCGQVVGRIEICGINQGDNNSPAGAAVQHGHDGYIQYARVVINTFYGPSSPASALEIMCHEIGHAIGLGHTSEDGSSQGTCMDYSPLVTTTPNNHDYLELVRMYGSSWGTTYSVTTGGVTTSYRTWR